MNAYFNDKEPGKAWGKQEERLLLAGKVEQVIDHIKTVTGEKNELAGKLMEYYRANQNRMDYPRYRKMGCGIIGSGAIESAPRTVVQKRMKQSGQRWTRTGAQNMLNLRVTT